MTFSEHMTQWNGKPVVDFEPEMTLQPAAQSYRLRLDYDSGINFGELLTAFLSSPGVDQVTGLLTGSWSQEMYEESMGEVIEQIIAAAGRLPSLSGLFFGDITFEENEVSWIQQGDVSPVWEAFPRLLALGVRGCTGLTLGQVAHDALRTLIIQGGGLPKSVLQEVAAARLPQLEHLELYLGTDDYGWDGTVEDLQPILSGALFPKLKYLGLRDSEIADDVAAAVCQAPILGQLEELDLSLGTLGDVGAEHLLDCPAIKKLKRLNLAHHYMSDAVMARVAKLCPSVNVDDQDKEGEYGRYVSIGE